jgi:hypothetical protein
LRFIPQKLQQNPEVILKHRLATEINKEAKWRVSTSIREVSEWTSDIEVALQEPSIESIGIEEASAEKHCELDWCREAEVAVSFNQITTIVRSKETALQN